MLYYIHGYLSAPNSVKGTLFRKTLNAIPIKYGDCKPEDIVISDCLKRISDFIKDDKNVVLIGSSLGGFLAASTALDNSSVKKLILLNPAVIPSLSDIDKNKDVPRSILKDMIDKRLFEQQLDAEITILVGTEDIVIPREWILKFASFQEAVVYFLHDDHSFSKNLKRLPHIISKILNS